MNSLDELMKIIIENKMSNYDQGVNDGLNAALRFINNEIDLKEYLNDLRCVRQSELVDCFLDFDIEVEE